MFLAMVLRESDSVSAQAEIRELCSVHGLLARACVSNPAGLGNQRVSIDPSYPRGAFKK